MKKFSIVLEKLKTGKVRATGRLEGRTVVYKEADESESKNLVKSVLSDTCGHLQNGLGQFDMQYINLNKMAADALAI